MQQLLLTARPTVGPDLVTNGNFDSDTAWTKGSGWTIAAGKASYSGAGSGTLSQALTLTAGATYRVTYTVGDWAGSGTGVVAIITGGSSVIGTARSANGTYTQELVAPASPTGIAISPEGGGEVFSADGVSVRRVY